jgi:hypothetical protein
MVANDPTLCVVWQDARAGTWNVFARASADFGATWPAGEALVDGGFPGFNNAFAPAACGSGTNVYVAWSDDRNGLTDVYFTRSTDGGFTWVRPDVRLDTNAAGAAASGSVDVACQGNDVFVVWQDIRNGWPDVYFNRSADGGVTWLAQDVRMDTDVPGAALSLQPRVAVALPYVYVVWSDLRNGMPDVYLRRSGDGGATWTPADVRLDTDAAGAAQSANPSVVASGPAACVAWEDGRAGAPDVRLSSTGDGGLTWSAADVRLDTDVAGAAGSWRPVLWASGTTFVAAWEDQRAGLGDVRASRSTDGGATWLAADLRLDTDAAGAALSTSVTITGSGTNVYVAWQDTRAGGFDVRFNASVDGGASWMSSDVRLDTDAPGATPSGPPVLGASGAKVRAAWDDARTVGPIDIRYISSDP